MRTVLCAMAFSLVTTTAFAAEKVALLIGSGAYSTAMPLPNPGNDVRALARTLEDHGFEVDTRIDLTRLEMLRALRDFRLQADQSDVAMVFYAGHGVEMDGTNYLLPVDASSEDERAILYEMITMDRILAHMAGAQRLRMFVLDACRDNPFSTRPGRRDPARSAKRGLAGVEAQTGDTLIAYAAGPGDCPLDGPPGGNSPYTRALIDALNGEALDVRLLFGVVHDNLRRAVLEAEPFMMTSLGGAAYVIQDEAASK
ncbi:MAG: caspase family protein [Pseudomonadota bacterium]